MLRLKRRSRDTISIVVGKKTHATKSYLQRGFLFAFFFHLCLLLFFQIRVQYVEKKGVQENASIVLLDSEDTLISLLTEEIPYAEDYAIKLSKELHLSRNIFSFTQEQVPYIDENPSSENIELTSMFLLPWSLFDGLSPAHYSVRAYPIKIILRDQLKRLYFIDDGADLFQKATYDTLFNTLFFAESQPRVHFHVEVSLKTGKIIHVVCLRELVDKRLQEIALKLLHTFQFASNHRNEQESVRGEMILQFCGTFDSIGPLLARVGKKDD